MMMVETELRPSQIQGIGVFLLEDVARGTLLWRFDSRVDRVYSKAELDSLPALTAGFIRRFSTWHQELGLWILCGDNGRHFNHSDTPNTLSLATGFGDDGQPRTSGRHRADLGYRRLDASACTTSISKGRAGGAARLRRQPRVPSSHSIPGQTVADIEPVARFGHRMRPARA